MEGIRISPSESDPPAASRRRLVLRVATSFLLCALFFVAAQAETVVTRKRVGNNSEGVTYVTTGHWKNRVVAIDGNDVLAINLGGPDDDAAESEGSGDFNASGNLSGPGWRKIFDILPLGPNAIIPRGILFLPGQNQFLFGTAQTSNLFRTDEFGNPLAAIVLSGLANPTDFFQYEGLTLLPADAPEHANTIAAIVIRASDFLAHVVYIRLDGTVEAEVLPQPGTPIESYVCGIAYQTPGKLLLSECGGGNYAMDLDGNFLGGPILSAPTNSGDIESILIDRFNRIFLGGYDGHLYAYDASYNRLPSSQDRSYVIGPGIPAGSLTWNPDARRFIFLNVNTNAIETTPFSLGSKRTLFTLDPVRAGNPVSVSYLGGGQLGVVNRTFPRGIQVLNLSDGSEVERLIFTPPTYPAGRPFQPTGAGALGSDRFLVRTIDDLSVLHIVSRSGTPDSTILPNAIFPDRLSDLPLNAPMVGRSLQVFDAGNGPMIFTSGTIFDFSGNLLHTVDQTALGVTVGLSQGTWIRDNVFAGIDAGTSTVIIYTVP